MLRLFRSAVLLALLGTPVAHAQVQEDEEAREAPKCEAVLAHEPSEYLQQQDRGEASVGDAAQT